MDCRYDDQGNHMTFNDRLLMTAEDWDDLIYWIGKLFPGVLTVSEEKEICGN